MLSKLMNLLKSSNEKGIIIPLITNHGTGSVSLTILVVSTIIVILSLFKVDNLNFWESLAWNVTSAVLYYNRRAKISKDGFELGQDKDQEEEK